MQGGWQMGPLCAECQRNTMYSSESNQGPCALKGEMLWQGHYWELGASGSE